MTRREKNVVKNVTRIENIVRVLLMFNFDNSMYPRLNNILNYTHSIKRAMWRGKKEVTITKEDFNNSIDNFNKALKYYMIDEKGKTK